VEVQRQVANHQFREHGIEGQDIALSLLLELGMVVLRLRVLARFPAASLVVSYRSYHCCKEDFDLHCHRSHPCRKKEEFGCRCHHSRRHRKRASWSHQLAWREASLLNLYPALDWGLDSVLACLREPRSRKAP
jgi:hypothetical protein